MIEIPGYRVQRQLGRGGMATVYLAIQESVDREVALKVMAPALLADPTFGERFLREARIAAKLRHPHVVGVHDVGRQGDYFYIAMEYLAGGPVLNAEGAARSVGFALRVVRETARALHYAHEKGFVHRDVKPDNILLREDGSSALTDFGIARANDGATRMTRTGSVVGTPHYMSPEQARGRPLDGRSDLYSLGIVLYELLVGRVPYHAEDSLAVGIMHITQPVPQLPQELCALQPLLDNLLAKQPDDRFQDGAAVATAIESLERRMQQGDLPGLQQGAKRKASRAAETMQSPAPAVRRREEPSFGRMDDIVAAVDRPGAHLRQAAPRGNGKGRFIFLGALAFVLAIGAFLAWRNQDKLRALLPRTELNDLLARGDVAIRTGKLTGNAGDSARELFEAARTIDPDNDLARAGLRRVGDALIEQAKAATAKHDYAAAHARLADARAVLAGGQAVEAAESELKRAESADTQVEDLIHRADTALNSGLLLGPDGAVALYNRVRDADESNALAKAGLLKAGAALAAQARESLAAGKVDEATARINDFATVLPNDPAIPHLRGDLAKAREAAGVAADAQLKRAQELLRAGRATGPGEDNALALFQAVIARDPANKQARAGLAAVAQALVVQANAALDDNNATNADRLLRQAEPLAPASPDLAAAKLRLRELREELDIAAKRPTLTAEQQQRLATLLTEAAKAAADGNVMLPPGTCAYDRYRAALALDPNNAAALAGLQALPQRTRDLFNQAQGEGKLDKAREWIDTLQQLAPGDAALAPMRSRLADAYLDEAEKRVGENRATDARRALDFARKLNAGNPRLGAIEQKLRDAPPQAADGGQSGGAR